MVTYSNGYIPADLLVTFATGWNSTDGDWKHQLSPSTYGKHLALVRRSPGGKLQVSSGWGAYRPYAAQVVARRRFGNGAAVPGTSSHGGFWEGRQTLAIDYHNWGSVYGWDQARFFADCRAVGLTPGMIMRSRGYPDEPWHVIDLDPWAPAPAGIGATPIAEDDMFNDEDRGALRRMLQILDAVDFRTGDGAGALEKVRSQVGDIHQRVNFAVRPDGTPHLIAVQGDVDQILAAVSRTSAGGVDVEDLAARIREGLGDEVADELAKRLTS